MVTEMIPLCGIADMKWYKHDPSAALAGMIGLTVEERGAYYTLMDLAYARAPNGDVTDDLVIQALHVRPQVWRRLKASLIAKGKVRESAGKLVANRVETEVQTASKLIAKAEHMREVSDRRRQENQRLNPLSLNDTTTTTSTSREEESSFPRGKEAELFGSNGMGPQPPADPKTELYRRGEEVLGKNSGGYITKLLKAKNGSIPQARSALEQASEKNNPREYIGRIINRRDDGPKQKIPGLI